MGAKGYSDLQKRTKEIYIEQHKNYSRDKSIFNRFLAVALDPKSYDLPKEFFAGKSVLDAGCGNTGYFQVAMHALGASHITCLDLGTEWMPELEKVMKEHGIPDSALSYREGSTAALPFADESFDFVASNGVLMHLESAIEAEKALCELARVTKKGGLIYAYAGISSPGIVDRYIVPALRKAYQEDSDFRQYIDNITPEQVTSDLLTCFSSAQEFDKSFPPSLQGYIQTLFTLDSATFTQNMLQVPVQLGTVLGFDWIKDKLDRLGFKNIRRVPEKYWVRSDYRKFLAPLHYNRDTRLSKLLYGDGHVKVVAEKL